MSQSSPGPFSIRSSYSGSGYTCITSPGNDHIAVVGRQEDAVLFCASPKLLKSLTNLVELARLGAAHLGKYHAALADAEAIIAEAKGEQP